MFAGRAEEIQYIEGCLTQTKNGNPKHFIICGERGIGKSSLVLVEQLCARGKVQLTKAKFNFLVIDIRLRRDDGFIEVVDRIANALKREISRSDVFGDMVLKTIDFISKLEVGGIRYHGSTGAAEKEEAFNALVDDLEDTVLKMADAYDGILMLIDEADAPNSEADLGALCKLLTEEMAARQTDKVCIGLAGLPQLSSKLAASHESSLRLFQTLTLKPLSMEECAHVLDLGMTEANEKNVVQIEMIPETKDIISTFSEGYPHFLQEFAYFAFEHDSDNNITPDDFLRSLFAENGAFDQLGVKYFDKPYNTPASDDYRKVLHAMAPKFDGWVSRSSIIEDSGLKGSTVDNALRALKNKGIIIQDEVKAGRYRLPTRSFATWINLQKRVDELDA